MKKAAKKVKKKTVNTMTRRELYEFNRYKEDIIRQTVCTIADTLFTYEKITHKHSYLADKLRLILSLIQDKVDYCQTVIKAAESNESSDEAMLERGKVIGFLDMANNIQIMLADHADMERRELMKSSTERFYRYENIN